MKKNQIIIGIVVLIVIVGGAWFFLSRGGGGAVIPGTTTNNPKTLAAMIAAGVPVQCTLAASEANGNMSGTFYVSDKNVRGDYTVNDGGEPMSGHMIVKGDTSYMWFEGAKTGFKMTAPKGETNVNTSAENQQFNPNEEMDFQCGAWVPNPSLFALPSGVTFNEFALPTMPPATNSPTGGASGVAPSGAADCSVCDSLPASYQAQCKQSLGCK
jgi:hypothetical protein